MPELKILACQIEIPATTTIECQVNHLKKSATTAELWLKANPADILVLPELSSMDYSNRSFEQLDTLAENDHGISFNTWRNVAISNSCWVVYGFARRKPTEGSSAFSIATGIISPTGELQGIYEKMHLAQFGASEEKNYFNVSGNKLLIFECKGFKLAPVICYDIRFPELSRTLVLQHDVDCILHTGAYARDASFDSWHAFVKTRAMENQVYVLSLNRAGEYFGNSVFMPPWVNEQAVDTSNLSTRFEEHQEQCLLLTLDKKTLNQAREEFHFLDDRLASYDLAATVI